MTQQPRTRSKEYVRKIPTKEQVAYAARRQALQEADQSYSGHFAGIHPEQPYVNEDELEEDQAYYDTRLPTSARRYQGYALSPEEIYQSGNTRYHVQYVDVPKRKSRYQQLPPPQQHERSIEEVETPVATQHTRSIHPLAWFGLFLTLLIVGWLGLNFVISWYQGVQNDWTYGQQRHFEINAVVGHNDSQTNPSHFTAENTNGQIIVMELPGGNVAKAKIYQIETVPGNAGNPPVKLSFQDMNADGKPDMLVQIGDGSATLYVTLFNNGSQFVSKL